VIFKLFNYFLIVFLLQSCSGGGVGNFLELSFRNIKEDELKSIENNVKSEKVSLNNKNLKDSYKPEIIKTNKDFPKPSNKINTQKQNLKSDEISNKKKKVIQQNIVEGKNKKIKTNYEPQSYRVVIILKGVDPTDPSQKFSNVLKNANIIYEIEKIERFQENDLKN
tara:strand:- start:123 stop:620 length:498 start_codon:yes stop_codon:yes gene_type:complete